jgi:hypothetical protein
MEGDAELAQLRAKRISELQKQHGSVSKLISCSHLSNFHERFYHLLFFQSQLASSMATPDQLDKEKAEKE